MASCLPQKLCYFCFFFAFKICVEVSVAAQLDRRICRQMFENFAGFPNFSNSKISSFYSLRLQHATANASRGYTSGFVYKIIINTSIPLRRLKSISVLVENAKHLQIHSGWLQAVNKDQEAQEENLSFERCPVDDHFVFAVFNFGNRFANIDHFNLQLNQINWIAPSSKSAGCVNLWSSAIWSGLLGSDINQLQICPSPIEETTRKKTNAVEHCGRKHCYDMSEEKTTWFQAAVKCRAKGGYLATVSSEEVAQEIENLIKTTSSADAAYWIGATDLQFESDFAWTDGSRVIYTKWFPGWRQFGFYNLQPNDDGLSDQDCVELRNRFSYPSKGIGNAGHYFWNDANCQNKNQFICQNSTSGNYEDSDLELQKSKWKHCNETIHLNSSNWLTTVTSPTYPRNYPDFADCFTKVTADAGLQITLEFSMFVLEEPDDNNFCQYDYLQIYTENQPRFGASSASTSERFCGHWSARLKLLRHVVQAPLALVLWFHSDHSRNYAGFKASVRVEQLSLISADPCNNRMIKRFEKHCYMIVHYPKVNWTAAEASCRSIGAQLAKIESELQTQFIVNEISRSASFTGTENIWLGGKKFSHAIGWVWLDDFTVEGYTDWFHGDKSSNVPAEPSSLSDVSCLALKQQFTVSNSATNALWSADRLYWSAINCSSVAGYICQKPVPELYEGQRLWRNYTGSLQGNVSLPSYLHSSYPNNVEFIAVITGAPHTRVVVSILEIDIEYQIDCLYDYVEVMIDRLDTTVHRYCGRNVDVPDFVSSSNEATILFRSDYSIGGKGFFASYSIISVAGCHQSITVKPDSAGLITSVNFPDYYLNALQCETTMSVPKDHQQILLEFKYFDVGTAAETSKEENNCENTDYVQLFLHPVLKGSPLNDLKLCGAREQLASSTLLRRYFVSFQNSLTVNFVSDKAGRGRGYRAAYSAISSSFVRRTILLSTNDSFQLSSPNYPKPYPDNLCFEILLRTSYGFQISLSFTELYLKPEQSSDQHSWSFIDDAAQKLSYSPLSEPQRLISSLWNRFTVRLCTVGPKANFAAGKNNANQSTVRIDDRLTNQRRRFLAVVVVRKDPQFWSSKVLNATGVIESCNPNPCLNNAPCLEGPSSFFYCKCDIAYLGAFCHMSYCDLKRPCVNGVCKATKSEQFHCICHKGFTGKFCQSRIYPCENNTCQRGTCMENLDRPSGFQCNCFEGYKGELCQIKDLFDARTLRESFLRDPLWLGLYLVLAVMSLVGLVQYARKKCSEKHISSSSNINTISIGLLCRFFKKKSSCDADDTDDDDIIKQFKNQTLILVDGDCEIYIDLGDLGMCSTKDGSVQFGDVTFKINLSELTPEQLGVIENYLSCLAEVYLPMSHDQATAKDDLNGVLQSPSKAKFEKLSEASEELTDVIMRTAEIVAPTTSSRNRSFETVTNRYIKKYAIRKNQSQLELQRSMQHVEPMESMALAALTLFIRPTNPGYELVDSVDIVDNRSTNDETDNVADSAILVDAYNNDNNENNSTNIGVTFVET